MEYRRIILIIILLAFLILYLTLFPLFPFKEDTMNEDFWEPGVYEINQRSGPANSSVLLEKIIVHYEACAIFFHVNPQIQYDSFIIRKNRAKIDFPEGNSQDLFIKMGYCRLPYPPLDIYFGRTQTYMNLYSNIVYPWHFRLKKVHTHKSSSEIICRSIPIESFFLPDNDDKKIYINRIITGQFTPECSYTLIKGDFREIESEIFGGKGRRFFYLMCTPCDDTTKSYSFSFKYNPYIKALESTCRFIPPEYSVIGCRLQTHEEVSCHSSKISIMSDPPIAPGKSFEIKSYTKSWVPWKNLSLIHI